MGGPSGKSVPPAPADACPLAPRPCPPPTVGRIGAYGVWLQDPFLSKGSSWKADPHRHCFPEPPRDPCSCPWTFSSPCCEGFIHQGGRSPTRLEMAPEPVLFSWRPPPTPPGCKDPPRPLSEAICRQHRESPGRSRSAVTSWRYVSAVIGRRQHLPTLTSTMVGHLGCGPLPGAASNSSLYYIFSLN